VEREGGGALGLRTSSLGFKALIVYNLSCRGVSGDRTGVDRQQCRYGAGAGETFPPLPPFCVQSFCACSRTLQLGSSRSPEEMATWSAKPSPSAQSWPRTLN